MQRLYFARRVLAIVASIIALAPAAASPVPGVEGDECSSAIPASIGLNGPISTAGMTASASPPASDASCTYLQWTPTTRDAWWVFNAPAAGTLTLDFCPSNYDTSVVLYQGSCGSLVRIACDDDGCQPAGPIYQSRMVDEPVAAGPVYIRVGGYGGSTGVAQFTLGFTATGDECSSAIPARLGLNDSVDTSAMTASANPPAAGECQYLNWQSITKDAWWVYDAPTAGLLSLHFCASNYDTSVVVYQGDCGSLTRIGCDDDGCNPYGPTFQSKIDGLPVAAGPVFIRVGGFYASTGIARFTLDFDAVGRTVGWGRNDHGQCNMPASLGTVTATSGGIGYTMARKWDGTVACWGYNIYGQCNVPTSLGAVAAIHAGESHSVALRPDGTVVCWGATPMARAMCRRRSGGSRRSRREGASPSPCRGMARSSAGATTRSVSAMCLHRSARSPRSLREACMRAHSRPTERSPAGDETSVVNAMCLARSARSRRSRSEGNTPWR